MAKAPPEGQLQRLGASDAVAALLVLEDGRYLLQHRDDIPGIWYPGHWGCFGGSVDDGEKPLEALRRELREELELEPGGDLRFFTRFDFDLSELGLGRYYRTYYVVAVRHDQHVRLVLHEGQGMGAFAADVALRELPVTPYDAFALFLHSSRRAIGRGWVRETTL